jgi:hypothetical protein
VRHHGSFEDPSWIDESDTWKRFNWCSKLFRRAGGNERMQLHFLQVKFTESAKFAVMKSGIYFGS